MEQKLIKTYDVLSATKETCMVDSLDGKMYNTAIVNVDNILNACREARTSEGSKTIRKYGKLMDHGDYKWEGAIPYNAFICEKLYLEEPEVLYRWLETNPKFKATNAKLA